MDSDSGNEDASEEEDEFEEEDEDEEEDGSEDEDEDDNWTSGSGDESEFGQEPGLVLNKEPRQSGSSAKIPCPPPYLSDDLSGNLLGQYWSVSAFKFDRMSYEHFLLLPPTVVWIILQVQGNPFDKRDQVASLENLLNQACESWDNQRQKPELSTDPAPTAVRTSKKRKAQD